MKSSHKLTLIIMALSLGTGLLRANSGFYAEISPTFMTAKPTVTTEYVLETDETEWSTGYPILNEDRCTVAKTSTNFTGATIGLGKQFGKWHQVQVDVGYFTGSTDVRLTSYEYYYIGSMRVQRGNGTAVTKSAKTTVIPILASYNVTWNFAQNFTLKGGPVVGYTKTKTTGILAYINPHDYYAGYDLSGSESTNSLSYGVNGAVQFDITNKFYVQGGVRYLSVKLNGKNTGTVSGILTVGCKF